MVKKTLLILFLVFSSLSVSAQITMHFILMRGEGITAYQIDEGTWRNMDFLTVVGGCLSCDELELIAKFGREGRLSKIDLSKTTIENDSLPDHVFKDFARLTDVVLPSNLRVIGESAFSGCSLLRSVNLPESLTTIHANAFWMCESLAGSIILPRGIKELEGGTFAGCSNITEVILNEGISSLRGLDFWGLKQLGRIVFPESLADIGRGSFAGSGLNEVVLTSTGCVIYTDVFAGCKQLKTIYSKSAIPPVIICDEQDAAPESIILYVPRGSADAYRSSFWWKDFAHIMETDDFPTSVTAVRMSSSDRASYTINGYGCNRLNTKGLYIEGGRKILKR